MNTRKDVLTKMLKGMLDIVILTMLQAKPMHGYAFISAIRKQFGVYLGASTIYPLLNILEKKGYVKSEWNFNMDRPRKIYRITPEGEAYLEQTEKELRIIIQPLLPTPIRST